MLEVCYVALIDEIQYPSRTLVIFLIYLFLTGLLHFLISSLFRHVKLFSHHRRTQDFITDGVHVVGRWATESRGQKSPSGVHGKALIGSLGTKSPEAEAKCEISVQFQTFSCRKFRI